jgi:hypothetical protein
MNIGLKFPLRELRIEKSSHQHMPYSVNHGIYFGPGGVDYSPSAFETEWVLGPD